MCWSADHLRPVFDALIADLKQSTKLFMDETRVSVLAPFSSSQAATAGQWANAKPKWIHPGAGPR